MIDFASKYLIDYDYDAKDDFWETVHAASLNMEGSERGSGRSQVQLEAALENIVLEYALSEALGLEKLEFPRFTADLRDNDVGGVRIDVKRQRGQYFERRPEHLASLSSNLENVELIVTGDYRHVPNSKLFKCVFKQAFLVSSLFKPIKTGDAQFRTSSLFTLSKMNDAPAFKKDNGIHYYRHRDAALKGKCVYRQGDFLCA